jgi:hypothetical protein
MRSAVLMLALFLGSRVAMAQDGPRDPTAAAMAALKVVLPRAAEQELALSAAPHEVIVRAIDAGFAAGTFRRPSTGGVAYMLAGDVALDPQTGRVIRQLYPGHYMFYATGASSAQLGYSTDGARSDATLPFVFSGGAGGAHGLSYIIVMRHTP